MKGLTLNQREQARLEILNHVLQGWMRVHEAASLLGVSERQAWRLLEAYRKQGAAALAHGNEGRRPVNITPTMVQDQVVTVARTQYVGLNHTHLTELLAERAGIGLARTKGRIVPSDAAGLRTRLSSRAARYATRHLGVHLVMSVAIAIPIPGIRSAERFLWTFTFWVKAQLRRLRRKRGAGAGQVSNIHTPLVMGLALVPALGGAAYLASSPLRSKLLARLMLDQVAWKLSFKLYHRTRIGRWLAPPVKHAEPQSAGATPVETL